jgi:hypothetical protein
MDRFPPASAAFRVAPVTESRDAAPASSRTPRRVDSLSTMRAARKA